jgi:transposase-like protein
MVAPKQAEPLKGRGGFPSAYDPSRHPIIAQALARTGYTTTEIAKALGLSKRCLDKWAALHPEFESALRGSRIEADSMVTASLYKRAIGYEYEETEASVNREGGASRVRKTKKTMPPDVTACIFWLKNRQPDKWRTNPEAAADNAVGQAAYLTLLDTWRAGYNATRKSDAEAARVDNGVDSAP